MLTLPTAIFANEYSEWEELLAPNATLPSAMNQNDHSNPPPSQDDSQHIEYQILRVDQEILILKAELAYQNGEENTLKNYLNQLDKIGVLPLFQARVTRLKQLQPVTPNISTPIVASHLMIKNGVQPLTFSKDEEEVVAILLPLTGEYEQVGNQLLESLLSGLERIDFLGSLVVLDTMLYEGAFDVWQQVKAYEPSVVFGPLRKSVAAEWQVLNTGIPILYFNEMAFLNGNERAVSPSRVRGVMQLMHFLNEHDYQNILVLTEDSSASQNLESAFYSQWLSSQQPGLYQHQKIENTVGEAVELATNIKRSKARKHWLQRKLDANLVFKPRAREDIDVVVSFVSERKGIQVAPILDFYQLTDVPRIWFPTQPPSSRILNENPTSWHDSYAVLPPYLYRRWQKKIQQGEMSEESGLFYALGQVAVEIVNNATISDGLEWYVETEFGAIASDSSGQFYLLPMIYSLDSRNVK